MIRIFRFMSMESSGPPLFEKDGPDKLRLKILMKLSFTEMDETNARKILAWRYAEPYSCYNPNRSDLENDLQILTAPQNLYYAMSDENGVLAAYVCFGQEARVAGGSYTEDALDIGCGARPDLTGRGFGSSVIQAGIGFAQDKFAPRAFRATVAAFNQRALKLCERAGFAIVRTFRRAEDETEFIILLHSL
jgi:[ribosomal protein S18]-alanine N-acetyltransferase